MSKTLYEKMQPMLDRLQAEALGANPSAIEKVEFANTLLNRAAGTVASTVEARSCPHRAVSAWLGLWKDAATARMLSGGAKDARH